MKRRRQLLQVSTFPFLAVLLCAMGGLILFLIVMDKRAKIVARNKALAEAALHAAQRDELSAAHQAEWQRQKLALHEQLLHQDHELRHEKDLMEKDLVSILAQFQARKQRLHDLQDGITLHKGKIVQDQTALAGSQSALLKADQKAGASSKELQRLTLELIQLESTFKDLQLVKSQEKETYSLVPYRGKRGDSRKPIYLECSPYGVIFHPDRASLAQENLDFKHIRSEVERRIGPLQKKREASAGDKPYVLVLVRPGGIAHYYQVQAALVDYHLDFGYELVEADWVFDFSAEDFAAAQPWHKGTTPLKSGGPLLGPPQVSLAGPGAPHGPDGPPRPYGPSGPGAPNGQTGPQGPSGMSKPPGVGSASPVGPPGASSPTPYSGPPRPGTLAGPNEPTIVTPNWVSSKGLPKSSVPGNAEMSAPGKSASELTNKGINLSPGPGTSSTVGELTNPSLSPALKPTPVANAPGMQGWNKPVVLNPGTNPGLPAKTNGPGVPQAGIVSTPGDDPQNPFYMPGSLTLPKNAVAGKKSGTGTPGQQAGTPSSLGNPGSPERTSGAAGEKGKVALFGAVESGKPRPAPPPVSKVLGNRDFPIVIECTAEGVQLLPGGQVFTLGTGPDQVRADRGLVPAVKQLIARRQASVRPGEPPYRPLLRFKIQPDGLRAYYLVYPLLEELRLPMSRENVEE